MDFIIVEVIGFLIFIAGFLSLRKEKRLFANAIETQAQVVEYYEYTYTHEDNTYLTMVVEYFDTKGNKIRAKEQKSSTRQKYEIGTNLSIKYAQEKPDFFIVSGDHSRTIVQWVMIIMGLTMMVLLGYALM